MVLKYQQAKEKDNTKNHCSKIIKINGNFIVKKSEKEYLDRAWNHNIEYYLLILR